MSFARRLYNRVFDWETRKRIYKWRNPEHFRRMRTAINPSPKGDFSLRPFDEHRCIFVHITKSAGTSVALALFGHLPYHHTARDYRIIFGHRDFSEYYKFAFVRNPWDRLYSAYSYLMGGGWNEDDARWAEQHLSRFDSFEDFVCNGLSVDTRSQHLHFRAQIDFVGDRRQRPLIDELLYFETLAEDFNRVAERLGVEARLEHRNPSLRAGYREVYTPAMIDIVRSVYADDIRCFGYEFEGVQQRMAPAGAHWQAHG